MNSGSIVSFVVALGYLLITPALRKPMFQVDRSGSPMLFSNALYWMASAA